MLLHGYFRSSAAYRVRIALNLKGLSYEQSFVHLRRGEQRGDAYRMLNPQGLVPALDTGEGVLIQSYWRSVFNHSNGKFASVDVHPFYQLDLHDIHMVG